MSRGDILLFSDYDLNSVLQRQEAQLLKEIDALEGNRLLNTSVEDLCDYFEQKYRVEVPRLRESEITVDQSETDVDVSQDPLRAIFDRSRPFYIKGTTVRFFIPFDGDQELFRCRPQTFSLNPPRGSVAAGQLILAFTRTEHDANEIRSAFDSSLGRIRQYLGWIESSVSAWNVSLRDKARQRIETRRQKLLKDQGLVAALGFPLIKREHAPQTYVVPTVRRKVTPSLPRASTAPFVPEPTLDMQEYEHILSVITNMVAVIERSPEAFKGMREEDLRQHFLVQLNGQYEGQAMGETFNLQGKTDILIRAEGKNVFIAECKFWSGPESLMRAIDQLLDYTSWRDTKTALLLFNRSKAFSRVLSGIPEVVRAHPNFKRELPYSSESGFRFVLHHRDDINRELILTVLAFEVPT